MSIAQNDTGEAVLLTSFHGSPPIGQMKRQESKKMCSAAVAASYLQPDPGWSFACGSSEKHGRHCAPPSDEISQLVQRHLKDIPSVRGVQVSSSQLC